MKKSGGAAVAALLFLIGFCLIGMNIGSDGVRLMDMRTIAFIHSFTTDRLTFYMNGISFIGSEKSIIGLSLILGLCVWQKKIRLLDWLKIGLTTAGSALINELLKAVIHRPRPELFRLGEATGYSFPSGHSMNGLVFFGLLGIFIFSRIKTPWRYFYAVLFALFILNVGISRIYLGVHYPSDVAGGFLLGASILCLVQGLTVLYKNIKIQSRE